MNRTRSHHDWSAHELAMRVFVWIEQRHSAWPEDVIARFGVSQPTANRLLNTYHDVKGLSRPRRGNWPQRS